MRKLICWLLLLVVVGMFSGCGSDNDHTMIRQLVLYGTTVGNDTLGPSDLVVLNPNTGEYIRTIGSTGYYINGLTWDRTTGRLYATTSDNDPIYPDGLLVINQLTGAGTPVGTGFGGLVNVPTVNSLGEMFGWTEDSDDLVSIDKTAGTATLIGDSGLNTRRTGLAFDNNDILWLVNDYNLDSGIYTVNTATGAATFVAALPVPRAHHGDFHPRTGLYWGIDQTDGTAGGAPARNLYVLDLPTGTLEDTLPTVDYLHTVAFAYKWVTF